MYILVRIIMTFVSVINFAILVRCIISWLPIPRNNPIYTITALITEPILAPIRNMIANSPIGGSGLDFSPFIAIILLNAVQSLAISLLL